MASDSVPMTLNGKRLLEEELHRLMHVDRPEVIAAIEFARSNGDLSENADYSAAKERQGFIEGRIQDINGKFMRADVIDPSKLNADRVVFGASVDLEDEHGAKVFYQIVGVDEADIKKGKIGISSPLARAMIGKREGEEVIVYAPKGEITYSILKIRYL
jgi:transcription elongation factor GreA